MRAMRSATSVLRLGWPLWLGGLMWVCSFCCLSAGVSEGRAEFHRDAIVSPEDFSYGLLAKLAADGRVPGAPAVWFGGDFQWTRLEMARFVAAALGRRNSEFGVRNPGLEDPGDEQISLPSEGAELGHLTSGIRHPTSEWIDRALAALVEEYRNELEYLAENAGSALGERLVAPGDSLSVWERVGVRRFASLTSPHPSPLPRGEGRGEEASSSPTDLPNPEFPIPNSERLYDRSALGVAELSARIESTGSAELAGSIGVFEQLGSPRRFAWVNLRPRVTTAPPPAETGLPARPLLHEAQASFYAGDGRLRVGMDHVRWGPGYRGTFPLSDYPDPFPMVEYRGRIDAPPCNVWPWRTFFSNVDWVIGSYPDQGVQTYLFGRRSELDVGGDVELGLYELSKTDRPPPWYYFLPIPLQMTTSVAQRYDPNYPGSVFDNRLIGVDLSYRAGPSLSLYGELAVDEINAVAIAQSLGLLGFLQDLFRPLGLKLFQGGPGPNELGVQIGGYLPRVFSDRTKLRVEYALTTAHYSIHPRNPAIDLDRSGLPLGHRIGADASGLFVRFERFASEKHSFAAEYETRVMNRSTASPASSQRLGLRYYYSAKPSDTYSLGLDVGPDGPVWTAGASVVF